MRVSVDPSDISFSPFANAAFITLDGKEIHLCITADEEEGIAVCIVEPLHKDAPGLETYTHHGKVKIAFPNDSLRREAEAWVADRCGEAMH